VCAEPSGSPCPTLCARRGRESALRFTDLFGMVVSIELAGSVSLCRFAVEVHGMQLTAQGESVPDCSATAEVNPSLGLLRSTSYWPPGPNAVFGIRHDDRIYPQPLFAAMNALQCPERLPWTKAAPLDRGLAAQCGARIRDGYTRRG
jgi:hypothetical protein